MRIVHLSTYDTKGGAARAAYRLHKGLQQLGHDSSMLVTHRQSHDPTVMAFVPPGDLMNRMHRRFRKEWITRNFSKYVSTRPAGYETFSDDRSVIGADLLNQLRACDVINLHWIAGFLDFRTFFSALAQNTPVFWRLADMNAFTGGCHFDHGCGRHILGCGACPQLGSTDPSDLSNQIWQRKRAVFNRLEPRKLHIVALNRWMADTVKRSPLLGKFPVTVIPNGVNIDTFSPRGIPEARDILRIPQEARVVLFVADSVTNRRKGFPLLVEALIASSEMKDLFLLSIGRGKPRFPSQIPHCHLGHLDDDYRLSLAYSAADVYVIPSLQDNQPNTVLEAMACGTPVVGFNVGGIAEMIRPGVTGLLTQAEDVAGLRAAIVEVLGCPERRLAMGAACRRIAVEEYALKTQVRRYAELYEAAVQEISHPTSTAQFYSSESF